jgi:hypothetical protein
VVPEAVADQKEMQPMRLRFALVPGLAVAAAAAIAAPAFAHEEITPKTIPLAQPAFLALTAANESSSDLVKIVLKAPTGAGLGETTRSPAGWSATSSANTITWTGGTLKPGTFETFGFEVEGPDQPGTLMFTVTSTFANGRGDEHEVEVAAVAPGADGTNPGTAPAATNTATSAPTSPTTGAAARDSDGDAENDSDGASGPAKAALGLSIVALLLAAGAIAMAARGRRGSSPPGGPTSPGAAQDW